MTRGLGTARRSAASIAVATALLAPAPAHGAAPAWQPLAAAPAERQEVTYVALDSRLYLAGGGSRAQDRYDPAGDSWEPVAELPPAFEGVDHVQGVAIGSEIVYAGGLRTWEEPFPVIGDVAIYDPGPGGGSFRAGAELPVPRAAGGIAAWHGEAIYAGGLDPDGSVARVDAYDPASDRWTHLADMPRPRDHFQAVVIGDELYAVGGRETSAGGAMTEVAAVDALELPDDISHLPESTWRPAVTELPTPRGGLGVAGVGRCILAIGGESGIGGAHVTGATEVYDTETGDWRTLAALPVPRHGIQAPVVGDEVYVAGGGLASFDFQPTAAQEALDLSADPVCGEPVGEGPGGGGEPTEGDGGESGESEGGGEGESEAGGEVDSRAPARARPRGQAGAAAAGAATRPAREIRRLSVRPSRLARGRHGRIVVALRRSARVLLAVQRARPGHLAGGRCLPGRGARDTQSCTAWVRSRRGLLSLPAGRNAIPYLGRRFVWTLPRGRYRAVAWARGERSRAFFRIAPPERSCPFAPRIALPDACLG